MITTIMVWTRAGHTGLLFDAYAHVGTVIAFHYLINTYSNSDACTDIKEMCSQMFTLEAGNTLLKVR